MCNSLIRKEGPNSGIKKKCDTFISSDWGMSDRTDAPTTHNLKLKNYHLSISETQAKLGFASKLETSHLMTLFMSTYNLYFLDREKIAQHWLVCGGHKAELGLELRGHPLPSSCFFGAYVPPFSLPACSGTAVGSLPCSEQQVGWGEAQTSLLNEIMLWSCNPLKIRLA